MNENRLVPGRACGECIACCKYFTIDTPELKKLPGDLCEHYIQRKGCGIYDKRPIACQDWYCGWRLLPQFNESWRPDRMEVMIEFREAPPGYAGMAIGFRLLGNLDVVLDMRFIDAVAAFVSSDVPVFLFVPGNVGQLSGKVFLNDGLKPSIVARNLAETRKQLALALEAGVRHKKERVTLNGGSAW